jgi:hypothetical protein
MLMETKVAASQQPPMTNNSVTLNRFSVTLERTDAVHNKVDYIAERVNEDVVK